MNDVSSPEQAHLWYEYIRDPEGFLIGPPMDLPIELRNNILLGKTLSPHNLLAWGEWVNRNNTPAEHLWNAGMYPNHPVPFSRGKITPYEHYKKERESRLCVDDEWIARNTNTNEIGTQQQRLSMFFGYVTATVAKRIRFKDGGFTKCVEINIRMEIIDALNGGGILSSVQEMIQHIIDVMVSLHSEQGLNTVVLKGPPGCQSKIGKRYQDKMKTVDNDGVRFVTLDHFTTKIEKTEVKWKFKIGPTVGKHRPGVYQECIFKRTGGREDVIFDWVPGEVEKRKKKEPRRERNKPVVGLDRTVVPYSVLYGIDINKPPKIPDASPFKQLMSGCYTMNDNKNHLCITKEGYSALHHFHAKDDRVVKKFKCKDPTCSESTIL